MGIPGGPSIGQLVGGVVGGIIGSIIPGFGTIAGFTIGLGIGTFIDPPRIEEPESSPLAFQDIQFNTFARNLPVPIIYGVNRVGGNVIWIGNTRTEIREHQAEGGKGLPGAPDPPTVQETIYHADFSLGLSEGEIQGVARTWLDDDDISDREGIDFTIFKGTSSQTIPSQMITALGSNALPFRHTAHALFSGELGNINRIPIVSQLVAGIQGQIAPVTTQVHTDIVNRAIGVATFEDNQLITIMHAIQNGAIYRTTDGSRTVQGGPDSWKKVYDPSSNSNTGLFTNYMIGIHPDVAGRAYCYAAGSFDRDGTVRTEDYGATWGNSAGTPGAIGYMQGVRGNSSEVIMLSDGPVGIAKSFDGGLSWTMQQCLDDNNMEALMNFPGTDVWIAAGANGQTYRSTDNGDTWVDGPQLGTALVNEATALTADIGLINHTLAINRTDDQGLSYTTVLSGDVGGGHRITHQLGTNTVYRHARVTASCEYFVSTDTGLTWTCIKSDALESRDIFITEFNHCWIGFGASVRCENVLIPTSCGNPALIVKDFLTNERYGLGLDELTDLNLPSFVNAGNFCAEAVPVSSGTFEQRFCLDIVLDRGKPSLDHLRDMLSTFRGFLTWSQGLVSLRIEKAEDVTQSFDMGNIVPDSFKWRKQSYRDRPNVVRVEYIEPGPNQDYRLDFQSAYDDWDIDLSGERRERIFRLIGIKRKAQAKRLATFFLDQAIHITNAAEFRVGIGALTSEVGDVIEVTHEVPNWVAKKFRIVSIEEAANDEFAVNILEYNASVFADGVGEEVADPDLNVPFDPFAVPFHPGRLNANQRSDGKVEIALSRTASNDLTFTHRIFIKRGTQEFEPIGQGLPTAPTAFIDSEVRTVAEIQEGDPPTAPGPGSGFSDDFDRASVESLGDPWGTIGGIPELWQIQSNAAMRGDTGSIGQVQSVSVAHTFSKTIGTDWLVKGVMFDSSGTADEPGVRLVGRWAETDGGEYYSMEYASRTSSHEIDKIEIWKTVAGDTHSRLAGVSVLGSLYFTIPESPTEFRFRKLEGTLTTWLNSVEILSVADNSLVGPGEGGLGFRERDYADMVIADAATAYWRLDESSGSATAFDLIGDHDGLYVGPGITWDAQTGIKSSTNAGIHITSAAVAGRMEVPAAKAAVDICQQNEFTVELWAASSFWTRFDTFPLFHACDAISPWELGVNNVGLGLYWAIRNGGANQQITTGGGELTASNTRYHHIIAIRTQSHMSVYVDATLEASAVVNCSQIQSFNSRFTIGQRLGTGDDDQSHCFLDELAFYPYELSSAQILAHFNCGVGSGCPAGTPAQGEKWEDFEWASITPQTTSGFSDNFNRSDANSAGDPWLDQNRSFLWRINTNTAQRGTRGAGTGSASVLRTDAKTITADFQVAAIMFDSSGTALSPGVAVMGRWQELPLVAEEPDSTYLDLVKTDTPMVYWRLNESSGSTQALNEMGSIHVGSYRASNVTLEASVNATIFSSAVFIGDGGNLGYVALDEAVTTSFFNEDVTIEVWAHSDDWHQHDATPALVGYGARFLMFLNDRRPMMMIKNADTIFYVVSGTTQLLEDGTRYHIVGTRTQTHQAIWVNATLEGSLSSPAGSLTNETAHFTLGKRLGAGFSDAEFRGILDEAAYYPFELTSSQIFDHYTVGDPHRETENFYGLEYASRTTSHEITKVDITRTTSGNVTTTLSTWVGSGFFTRPDASTEFKLQMQGSVLKGFLNDNEIVSAIDSVITGPGEGGLSYHTRHDIYRDLILGLGPTLYYRMDEASGTVNVEDLSGNSYFMTSVGSPALMGTSASLLESDPTNDAFRFTGSPPGDFFLIVDSHIMEQFTAHTVVVWVHSSRVEATGAIQLGATGQNRFNCHLPWSDNTILMDYGHESTGRIQADFSAHANTPTMVVMYSGGKSSAIHSESQHMAIWISSGDGIALANSVSPSDGPDAQLVGGAIGIAFSAEWDGTMDEFALFKNKELSSSQIFDLYRAGVAGSPPESPLQGESWDDFEYLPLFQHSSEILVRFVPDGWGVQLYNPNSTVIVGAVSTNGQVLITLPVVNQPASGFLLIHTDSGFIGEAVGGLFPLSGTTEFSGGDIFEYNLLADQFITATQTFIPIFAPKGGFANVGSARIRGEQMGYDTFTDSRIEGVTRGAGNTVATSHSNLTSLEATVLLSGGGLLDFSAAFVDPASNVALFTEQSQYLYLGTQSRFALVDVKLAANAPSPLAFGYEYSTADGVWADLQSSGFIPVFDSTSGFTQSGKMFLEPPGDWETTRGTLPGSNDLTDGTSRFFLRIINTNTAAMPPQEMMGFLDGQLLFAVRNPNAFLYPLTAPDSGQTLTFKAIAVGPKGQQADGTKAPTVTIVESGLS